MSTLNLIDYWWVLSFVVPSVIIAVFLAVRFALDVFDHHQSRRMDKHGQRFGSVDYYGKCRRNFRTGEWG